MLKKAKFWVPVATVVALTLTGSVYAATTSSSSSTTTPSATQHAHQGHQWRQHQAGFMGFNKQDNTALLSLLKIDAATFKQDLQSGKSIADIAAKQGVTEQQVIDLLTQNATTQLDQAVKNGKMTQAQEDKISANLATRIKKQVENKHTARPHGQWGHKTQSTQTQSQSQNQTQSQSGSSL